MNDETIKLVRDLADKLGTTTEHLWGVLVKQAAINASLTLVWNLFALIIFIILGYYIPRVIKKAADTDSEELSFALLIAAVALGVVCIVWICSIPGSISSIMSGFYNPEYWALNQLKVLK